jgi:uncharacterized membrane protein YdfJ with MMPL/SSD domain
LGTPGAVNERQQQPLPAMDAGDALVALGTGYNIFLMTRVHEESRHHGTRRGALVGLAATGG